ncbi:MAG TPA: prolyl oligopeptidase family serine peptidase [Candidatus Angelobacter sp.]|nr:prolyl oligopeptidase family serine peptidase [Candidatus Angelobacter sp.]
MHARRLVAVAATVVGVVGTVAAAAPVAQAQDDAGHWRPGPPILYQEPATAPQLTNAGPWQAQPLRVSGAHAYVEGEFLYQDFLYDDGGANGNLPDPNDKRPTNDTFSARTGTYSYPSDPRYLGNAADLVELRVKPLDGATAFRITLTELSNPSLVAATIGIGTPSSASKAFPYGANVNGPADHFLSFRGGAADFDGTPVPVTIDSNRAQIDLRVPTSLWNPGTSTVRLTAGVGLWDAANGRYLLPQTQSSATSPGGSGTLSTPAAFFNVAFREGETLASTAHPTSPSVKPTNCMWRDCLQAQALASNDISSLHDDVDFAKLDSETTDRSGVPTTGSIDRILSSHFDFGGGVTYAKANSQVDPTGYKGEYQGRLQPYNLYVPASYAQNKPLPLTLLLHSLGANFNQYMMSNNQTEFGLRDGGSIVATSESRGPDGWYYDSAEADVFEMWNDVAHHYQLDSTRTALTGYSMGGYATYKLGTQFPDLFARAFVTVGPPADGIWTGPPGVVPATGGDQTNTYFMLDSLRNLPILIWHGTNDELVPADGPQLVARQLDNLNYRYEIDTFPGFDHFAFAVVDNYTWPTAFLDNHTVVANPPHITYVVNPTMDFSGVGVVADKAYWLSGLTVRDPSKVRGNLDVRSEAFCTGDAPASATQFGADVAATPYTREYKTWGDAPAAPCADTLDITATNVSRVVVDAQRARVDCNVKVNLTSDGPVDVRIVNGDQACGGAPLEADALGGATLSGVDAAATGANLPNTAAASGAAGAAGVAALALGVAIRSARRRRTRRG